MSTAMFEPKTFSEQMLFTTTRIETARPEGETSATGFFFTFEPQGLAPKLAIVTNKHVKRDALTATHPSCDFNGNPEGMLDITTTPGSSGSPAAIVSDTLRTNRKPKPGESILTPGGILVLLGAISSAPTLRLEGTMERCTIATKRQQSYPVTKFPMNLAYYVKAKELLTLESLLLSAPAE
jgi:hypothetical protein